MKQFERNGFARAPRDGQPGARPGMGIASVIAVVGFALATASVEARITKIQITTKESPTFAGATFGAVGQYEKIVGKAFGEVDPKDPRNAVIVDIALAPKNANGNVEYSMDFYILKPIDLTKGNHRVFHEAPNRGTKLFGAYFNRMPNAGNDPGATSPANGFLMPLGYTMTWNGWDFAA